MTGKGRELHKFLNTPRPGCLMPTPFSSRCKVLPLSNVPPPPPLQLNSSPALILGEDGRSPSSGSPHSAAPLGSLAAPHIPILSPPTFSLAPAYICSQSHPTPTSNCPASPAPPPRYPAGRATVMKGQNGAGPSDTGPPFTQAHIWPGSNRVPVTVACRDLGI